jgi:hypothetical protein
MAHKQSGKKQSSDSFAFFKKAAEDAFRFLITDYDFKLVSTTVYPPECSIKYRNKTAGVNITYEWKSALWVELIRLRQEDSEVIEAERYGLSLLMETRRPDRNSNQARATGQEWSNEFLENLLREYANFLREYGSDVLTGDFTVFPVLKKLAAHYRRKRNKELFGTFSGETPRFSERPTLDELFADAKRVDPTLEKLFRGKLNQDKTPLRIYQAYWDYKYPIKEIADFLNVGEHSIKHSLDESDEYA